MILANIPNLLHILMLSSALILKWNVGPMLQFLCWTHVTGLSMLNSCYSLSLLDPGYRLVHVGLMLQLVSVGPMLQASPCWKHVIVFQCWTPVTG